MSWKITPNGWGFAKLGPFHHTLQKLITTKIVNNYIRWAEAPISSKPLLCTVDVPWVLRVEGQRSCRSPSYSLHHVCQKSKPQLATKHGFFNGIDCAYIACRRPSIPWFSEAKSKHTKLSTPGKIFTKVLSTFATLKKIQYLRQVVFKMSIFRKSDLPTMPIETTWANPLLAIILPPLTQFCLRETH